MNKRGKKETQYTQKTSSRRTDLNQNIPVFILNVNELNTLIKRQIVGRLSGSVC